jgi:beta-mannanase
MEVVEAGTFNMNQGENTIVITPNWTWFRIDYIRIVSNNSQIVFDIASETVDAQATEATQKMYFFLRENFGKKTISGIMTGDMTGANGNVTRHADVQAVYKVSGKYPALIGFDMMNATGLHAANSWERDYTSATMTLAKDTWRRGGLPAFTWHWRDPNHKVDDFYSSQCTTKISEAMNADGSWNTSSTLYKNLIRDIDAVADHFLDMQRRGMACIFRPLHEASGGWFWWGTDGGANYAKLYQLIVDEMVNVKGVHNVIWVWNPCNVEDADWNPGETYYDVVSIDIYNADFDYSSNYVAFDKLKTLTAGKKIIALSENGPIPDIDKEFEEDAVWSWWMPWYQTWNGNFVDKTSKEEWTKCMNDDRVITLEDLSAGWPTAILSPRSSFLIPHGKAIFDLQGRRLTKIPSKGLYILNGKKQLAK